MRHLDAHVARRAPVYLAAALLALSSACSPTADEDGSTNPTEVPSSAQETEALPEPVQALDINASEYVFDITPDPSKGIRPGWTLLEFHNEGAEAHQVMFARIKDGVDMSELAAAGANDSSGAGAIEFVDMIGGVSYIGAGQDTTAMVNLTEGTVMAMCYVPDAKGTAHALMGMSTVLTVSPDSPDAVAPGTTGDEEVVGTIEFDEDGYRLPEPMTTGWYHVRNSDSALHELALLRLGTPIDERETALVVEDLAANRTPEVDLEAVGGMGAISPGFDGYLYLELSEGDYLAVDFMPDPGRPRPHMLDGYYGTFTV